MAAEPSEANSRPTRFGSWVASNPLTAVSLVGLVVYGAMRLSAGLFYSHLGVTPEDVGLGYAQVISQTIYAVLAFWIVYLLFGYYAVVALVNFIWFFVLGFARSFVLFGRPRRRMGEGLDRAAERIRTAARTHIEESRKRLRSDIIFGIMMILNLTVLLAGSNAGQNASLGSSYKPSVFGVSWRAQAARIDWLSPPPQNVPVPNGRCVLYLGTNGGITVIYDPALREPLRIPASAILVTVSDRFVHKGTVRSTC